MDFRRRLIALHQDERGYALQGKRGSGLVSIELKGDTADISVTAKDLAEPKNGSYIVVLYPKNAQTTPYILGEIEYKERAMQLHKLLVNTSLPCDADDFRAASVLFVGTHIDFVLVGQTECTVDWPIVKSSIRLKGTASVLSSKTLGKTQRAQSVSVQQIDPEINKVSKATVKPLEIIEDLSPLDDVAAKPPKSDMKLKDYGKVHFVDNSGEMGNEVVANTIISNDFDSLKDIKEAKNIRESSKVLVAEIEDAKGFDYKELLNEDAKPTASNINEQSEQTEVDSFFNNQVEVLKPSGKETYSKIDNVKDLNFNELLKNVDKNSASKNSDSNVESVFKNLVINQQEQTQETISDNKAQTDDIDSIFNKHVEVLKPTDKETHSKIDNIKDLNFNDLLKDIDKNSDSKNSDVESTFSKLIDEQQEQTQEIFSDSIPVEIEDARGFDYSELLAEDSDETLETSKPISADKPKDINPSASVAISDIEDDIQDALGFDYSQLLEDSLPTGAEETTQDVSSNAENEQDDEPAIASVHYDKGLEHHITDPQDGETLESALSKGPVVKNNVRPLHDNSHLAKMTDEQYVESLDPYGEPSDVKEAIKEDIDPCVYNKNDVRKKMNICRRYGKRLQVRPFPAMTNSVWYKVDYPGMGSSFHYLIGNVLDEKGNVQVRCTAVPGPYGINPPAGLNGFTHYMTAQGMGNAGYWVSFTNPKTGKPVDAM